MADNGNSEAVPAGWYTDSDGVLRWWTGREWGPPAPAPYTPQRDVHLWAMLSHFGLLALYFVGPLIIRLTLGNNDDFIRHHSTEALNAQITFGIAWNVFGIGAMILSAVTGNGRFFLLLIGSGAAFVW